MKERPIIFSSDSVREILRRRKTQTRRVIKPQPDHFHTFDSGVWLPQIGDKEITFPYGRVGDRLWVRETLVRQGVSPFYGCTYKADITPVTAPTKTMYCGRSMWQWGQRYVLPSIFMPRWASRITLEIVSIRAELVQNISEEDCIAELGCTPKWPGPGPEPYKRYLKGCYAITWDTLNAKRGYPWDSNPWVWVIEFKQVH